VLGVDCFTDSAPRSWKEQHLADARSVDRYSFLEADLRVRDPHPMLDGVDVVFHLAGEPAVRGSWDEGFARYNEHNVLATHRLLDAARAVQGARFVYASASSVYGAAPGPWREDLLPGPRSPYGSTKLSAEHLFLMYREVFGIESTILRLFTVFGPRQRPDMAIAKIIEAGISDAEFTMFGLGDQVRNFTFVDDIVEATVRAANTDAAYGRTINIGGDTEEIARLVSRVERLLEREIRVTRLGGQPGDVGYPGADFGVAEEILGWRATTDLDDGLRQQITWRRSLSAS
jgi:nucleoside-diphosphate-sugar epimerase